MPQVQLNLRTGAREQIRKPNEDFTLIKLSGIKPSVILAALKRNYGVRRFDVMHSKVYIY